MKFKAILAAAALAFAGHASAWDITDTTITPAGILYLSGSSALGADITTEVTAVGSTVSNGTCDIYNDASGGGDLTAYACVGNGTLAAPLANANILIYYRKNGGSIFGVHPVGSSAIHFYDRAACGTRAAGANATTWTCPGWVTVGNNAALPAVIPDAGVSDVEPALFVGINQPAAAPCNIAPFFDNCPAAPAAVGYATAPVLAQSFGVVVNTNLANQINARCGTTGRPVLSSAWAANLMTIGSESFSTASLAQLDKLLVASGCTAGTPLAGSYTVCRRDPGSGTQAEIQACLFNTPCSANLLSPLAASRTVGTNVLTVTQSGGTSGVKSCLNTATVPAIGFLSYNAAPGPTDAYTFVNLDGIDGTVDANVVSGKVKCTAESTFQTSSTIGANAGIIAGALKTALTTVATGTTGVYNLKSSGIVGTKTMVVSHNGNQCTPLR